MTTKTPMPVKKYNEDEDQSSTTTGYGDSNAGTRPKAEGDNPKPGKQNNPKNPTKEPTK